MPVYEYACEKCQHEFEVEQRITDDPVKTCPECRSRKVKKLISQTSFVLKGGGWYSDLYSSTGKDKGKGKGDDGSGASESSSSSGAKDSKPASGGKSGGKSDSGGSGKKSSKGSKAAA